MAFEPLFRSITLRNLLSFGPDTPPLELRNLNVLIGPNGSGKSNFVEAFSLLRGCPRDVREVIFKGGGVGEWIWKGDPDSPASLDTQVGPIGERLLHHNFSFRAQQRQSFILHHELVEDERRNPYVTYVGGGLLLGTAMEGRSNAFDVSRSFDPNRSLLAQFRGPGPFEEVSQLARVYEQIKIYRDWTFGRSSDLRQPQKPDQLSWPLADDCSNLGLFLNRIERNRDARDALRGSLQDLYAEISDYHVSVEAGYVQVMFFEGKFEIPAVRLSDGSLRYLCLLAILHDPEPPPLIVIEEPELGLHPDLLHKIADLLVSASRRTQLIVTTHSDIIVDSLTDHAESVIICEKEQGCTTMKRLSQKELEPWLADYRLGQLWSQGDLGGNRW